MYAGCESSGGPCEGPNNRLLKCEISNTCGLGEYVMGVSRNCGTKRAPFVGAVPSFEQFSAQQRRAVAVCASLLGMSAALQQSMSPIAWSMLQDCSPNCTGMPPNALPLSISTSARDISRIRITPAYSMNRSFHLSRRLGPVITARNYFQLEPTVLRS